MQRMPLAAAGLVIAGAPGARAQTVPSEGARFDVRGFGAKGDGTTKDTAAAQRAIDAAGTGGGCAYFPPGRYLCGTLHLRSHVTVQLENGATLLAAPERADFDADEALGYDPHADKETSDFNHALLRGRDLTDVAIVGPGVIDMARTKRGGPKPIALKLCRSILIRDLRIENAPNYNISLLGCDFVDILGVTIRNGYCDGIDPDSCRQVRIANCSVESWDDAIVLKSSPALGYLRATEQVTVTGCILSTTCNALKLGTESSGGFRDILFQNCSLFSDTARWPGRPADCGVAIETVDGATVERVVVSNLTMRDVSAPIFVRIGSRGRAQATPSPGPLREISLGDIVATGTRWASAIMGIPGFPVRGLSLRNLRVAANGGGKPEWAARAIPEAVREYPDIDRFVELPAYGLYCRHAEGLLLDGLNFRHETPEARPAVVLEDVKEADVRTLIAQPPTGPGPVLRLRDAREVFIQGCRAREGTGTWARLEGSLTGQVHEAANDLARAGKPFELEPGMAQTVLTSGQRQAGMSRPSGE